MRNTKTKRSVTKATGRSPRRAAADADPHDKVLKRLQPEERARVLSSLLERQPELVGKARQIARAVVKDVDLEGVAEEVEWVLRLPDLDDLQGRAGRTRWGYVDPADAACELLDEALAPFLDEMKRDIELGFEKAATSICAGIILGLYRCRGGGSDLALDWAPDFPAETAKEAVAILSRESSQRHHRVWCVPDALVARVPEWAEMIRRESERQSAP
jgi:hypothetical protein